MIPVVRRAEKIEFDCFFPYLKAISYITELLDYDLLTFFDFEKTFTPAVELLTRHTNVNLT